MRVPVVVVVVVVGVLAAAAGQAGAHSDRGEFRLVALRAGELDHEVELVVDLAYEDGHAVYRGSVQLSGRADSGAALLPVPMDATTTDGRYVGRVELPPPGVWTLVVASTEPAAQLELLVDAASPQWVEEDLEPLPGGPDHGVPWRWIAVGMGAIAVVGMIGSWRRRSAQRDRADAAA